MMPGTAGHVHPSLLLWENQQTIIASLRTSGQSYDLIEITQMMDESYEGRFRNKIEVVNYWIDYVVRVETGNKKKRMNAEYKNDKRGTRWEWSSGKILTTSYLEGKHGIVRRSMGDVEEGEETVAECLNSDGELMEALGALAKERQFLDIWPSYDAPCCTYSQAVDSGHMTSNVGIDIAEKIARRIKTLRRDRFRW
jgi:hypothetical protein